MNDVHRYLIKNFFTHKDFLDSTFVPGILYTKNHIIFELLFLIVLIYLAYKLSENKDKIKKVFINLWIFLIFLEFMIIFWDTFAKNNNGIDFRYGLSLYPCSIFLFMLPYLIWGKHKKIATGYIGTLGLVGAIINLIYPYRLLDYSLFSFPAIHSLIFHGSMLFVYLVLIFSKYKIYEANNIKDLFYPCFASLIFSIPANILNYSSLDSDYMYFKGYHPFVQSFNLEPIKFTFYLYLVYIFIPTFFYIPSLLKNKKILKK